MQNSIAPVLTSLILLYTAGVQAMSLADFSRSRCLQETSCQDLGGGIFSLHIEAGEERAELRDPRVMAFGEAVTYQVQVRVPSTSQLSTAGGSIVILQFKAQNGMSPPMAFRVKEDGRLVITVRHDSADAELDNEGNGFEESLYQAPIAKDQWHAFTIRVRSGPDGYLQVDEGGQSLVNYNGRLGYSNTANYIKFGPYDYSKTQHSAYELQYKDYQVISESQNQTI